MLKLPRRETELAVDVGDGATLVMKPLSDQQYFLINENAQVDESKLVFRLSALPGLFEEQLLRVEGVELEDGTAIDASNLDHVAQLPQHWKGLALTRLVRYATGLTEGEVGNSKRRGSPSPTEEATSSTD